MNPEQISPNEKPVVYMDKGQRREVTEEQAMFMLHSIAQMDIKRALTHYLNLTNANPHAQRLLKAFYNTLADQYLFDELLDVTNKRLSRIPDCHVSFSSKIDALQQMFRHHEIVEEVSKVAARNPRDPMVRTILGSFYKDIGEFGEAKKNFDEAISLRPSYVPPYWHRSDLCDDPTTELAEVRKIIGSGDTDESDEHYLHFAAYRLAEKSGVFDDAIEHLHIANAMKRRHIDYDVDAEIAIDRSAKTIFTKAHLATFTSEPNSDLRPIFIMGMPRSGTTLVEQIIASHSNVAGGDEYTALSNAILRVQRHDDFKGSVDEWVATRGQNDWLDVGRVYESNMRFIRGDKHVFTDKNQFNHRSIGIIKAGLPNAKIIVVDRSPMDVAFGCYRQLFGGQGAKFSYQYDEIAKLYASYVALIDHWCDVTDGLILRVRYEELVQHPEPVTKSILAFCDLDFENACLNFHQTNRPVKTLSATQVRQPIFTEGIGRWRQYEASLKPLMEALETSELLSG